MPQEANTPTPKLNVDSRCAISSLALKEDRPDLGAKTVAQGGRLGPPRRGSLPSVAAAAGDTDVSAHEPDGVDGDEREFRPHVFIPLLESLGSEKS